MRKLEKVLDEIKNEILKTTGNVELIFVYGSYAFGKMQKYSDIDVAVFTRTGTRRKSTFRFVEHCGQKVLVTVHFKQFSKAIGQFRKPEEWVWDAAYEHAKVLYDRDQNMDRLKKELSKHRVASKDFLESVPDQACYLLEHVGKLRNAFSQDDELNLLYAARAIAEMCYSILRPFNPVWIYKSESETYLSFLGLRNKPKHYVEDFKTCYGLTLKKRPKDLLLTSGIRLATETSDFLRKHLAETGTRDKDFIEFLNSKDYRDFVKQPKSTQQIRMDHIARAEK